MKRTSGWILGLALSAFGALSAQAGVSLNGVRIGALDVAKLAAFYQQVLGMHEVQRIEAPQFLEIMLDFGATPAEAKANRNGDLVIMQRAADAHMDTMAHVVFDVTDISAVVAAWKKAGGTLEREPFEYGNTGIRIAMAVDPEGNHVEFIQPAP